MPISDIRISELAAPAFLPTLEHHYDFMMYLYTNNYSKFTIYNYFRDLIFFTLFLQEYNIDFKNLTVDHITNYKGWLKQRRHIVALVKYLINLSKTDTIAAQKAAKAMGVRRHLLKGVDDKLLKDLTQIISARTNNKSKSGDSRDPALSDRARKRKKLLEAANLSENEIKRIKNNNPKELSNKTINRMLITLRRYLKYLLVKGIAPPLLPDQVQLTRVEKKLLKVPELEAVIALVEAPSHLEKNTYVAKRNRAILELLLATGMRISELVALNKQDRNADQIYVKGKGKKERIVYLTPRAKKYLDEYLNLRSDSYPAMFIPLWAYRRSKSGIQKSVKTTDPRMSISYLQEKIVEYRTLLKLQYPISAHTIRHAFATYLIENGANVEAVRILLGHESIGTTTKYVHAAQEFAKQTHQTLHPVKE